MSVLALVFILLFLAGLWWLVNQKYAAQIGGPFKLLLNIVIFGTAVVLVLYAFGVWDMVKGVKVPKL